MSGCQPNQENQLAHPVGWCRATHALRSAPAPGRFGAIWGASLGGNIGAQGLVSQIVEIYKSRGEPATKADTADIESKEEGGDHP